ncbi:PREDICTED: uncharacterized protein LOC106121337 [Papilio xuthus]|uniref:Uncharacterized protein LOC106121337 n=1 Tax=Papilio xuthus TaxID=66420 RepID=A0A194PWK1_PAPXU|nr:PREDICTED: uncharacterized protein LOC106121337 [Papilio xuthus]KPI97388.1 hypothetical protein RR46_09295 [Papilio xuthus]
MHASLTLVLALTAHALAAPPRERAGFQREIDGTRYNQVPKIFDYVLSEDYLNSLRSKGKLVTKLRPEEALAADNVILESNVVRIVRPSKLRDSEDGVALVRQRRGYNLENVRVPARYPYLPVPRYNRLRRWG